MQPPRSAKQVPLVFGDNQIASPKTFVLLLFGIFVLFILRKPDCLLNPQFWAEDGAVFFREQLLRGFPHALVTPYAGYFAPLQRLIAFLAVPFGIRNAPLCYGLMALFIDSTCCAMFFLPRYRQYISSDYLRLIVCLLAATAFDSRELVGTMANSPWYLMVAGVLLAADPLFMDSTRKRLLTLAIAFAIGLSAPILFVVLPIAAYQLVRNRRSLAALPGLVIGLGGLLQTLFVVFSPHGITLQRPSVDSVVFALWVGFIYKVVLQSLVGISATMYIAQAGLTGLVLSALVVTVCALTFFWVKLERRDQERVGAALFLIAASIVVPLVGRNSVLKFGTLTQVAGRAERYFFLASFLFAYILAVILDRAIHAHPVCKCILLTAIFAGGIYGNFSVPAFADMHWKHYPKEIKSWVKAEHAGMSPPDLNVPINPPGWYIQFCSGTRMVSAADGQCLAKAADQ